MNVNSEGRFGQGRSHGFLSGGGGGRIVGSVANLPPKYPENRKKTGLGPLHARIWRGRPLLTFSLLGDASPPSPRCRCPWIWADTHLLLLNCVTQNDKQISRFERTHTASYKNWMRFIIMKSFHVQNVFPYMDRMYNRLCRTHTRQSLPRDMLKETTLYNSRSKTDKKRQRKS